MAHTHFKKDPVMKTLHLVIAGLGVLMASPSSVYAKNQMRVFACEPEWAALAEDIGGAHVRVTSATTAQQDVHHIRAKPSLLAAMRKADLVFCTGASLEIGWLPLLLKKAGHADVQMGARGSIMAADYVEMLNVMAHVDRSMGDIHPEGNPHIHLTPANIEIVARVLAERLSSLDAENAAQYDANLKAFSQKWRAAMARWNTEKAVLAGKKVIVHHKSWVYLLDWLGIETLASLEPKAGIPPTASHLKTVLDTTRDDEIHAILITPFDSDDAANWLSEKTGIPVVELPFTIGGNDQAQDLISLFDNTLRLLKDAQ